MSNLRKYIRNTLKEVYTTPQKTDNYNYNLNEDEHTDDILKNADPLKPIMRSDLIGSPYTEKIGYSRLPNLDIVHAVEFVPFGTFGANSNAETYLKEMGYNYGSMEGPNPIGFSNKYNSISKWGNMTSEEHTKLDGVIIPDGDSWRENGAIIMWFNPPTY
jgi:hypothetical protein